MNALLNRLHAIAALWWIRAIQFANWIAISAAAAAVTIDAAYHNEIEEALSHVNPVIKIAVLVGWALLVHYGLRRAAKAAS